ncbi:hypothetical protein PQR05_36535 [Paraburkholderia sediminicola]|uniref:hypothetical protein n=1 Tax=Paraburkholderia sediminicola TaxID=458836 RepID=UPI0038BAB8D7
MSNLVNSLPTWAHVRQYSFREFTQSRRSIVEEFNAQVRQCADNPQGQVEAFRLFREKITGMGFWDCVKDFLIPGRNKEETLQSLYRCHLYSLPEGRRHLANAGELALAETNCHEIFGDLDPSARIEMLASVKVSDCCNLPFLTLGNSALSLPLVKACWDIGNGGISSGELKGFTVDDWAEKVAGDTCSTEFSETAGTFFLWKGALPIAYCCFKRAMKFAVKQGLFEKANDCLVQAVQLSSDQDQNAALYWEASTHFRDAAQQVTCHDRRAALYVHAAYYARLSAGAATNSDKKEQSQKLSSDCYLDAATSAEGQSMYEKAGDWTLLSVECETNTGMWTPRLLTAGAHFVKAAENASAPNLRGALYQKAGDCCRRTLIPTSHKKAAQYYLLAAEVMVDKKALAQLHGKIADCYAASGTLDDSKTAQRHWLSALELSEAPAEKVVFIEAAIDCELSISQNKRAVGEEGQFLRKVGDSYWMAANCATNDETKSNLLEKAGCCYRAENYSSTHEHKEFLEKAVLCFMYSANYRNRDSIWRKLVATMGDCLISLAKLEEHPEIKIKILSNAELCIMRAWSSEIDSIKREHLRNTLHLLQQGKRVISDPIASTRHLGEFTDLELSSFIPDAKPQLPLHATLVGNDKLLPQVDPENCLNPILKIAVSKNLSVENLQDLNTTLADKSVVDKRQEKFGNLDEELLLAAGNDVQELLPQVNSENRLNRGPEIAVSPLPSIGDSLNVSLTDTDRENSYEEGTQITRLLAGFFGQSTPPRQALTPQSLNELMDRIFGGWKAATGPIGIHESKQMWRSQLIGDVQYVITSVAHDLPINCNCMQSAQSGGIHAAELLHNLLRDYPGESMRVLLPIAQSNSYIWGQRAHFILLDVKIELGKLIFAKIHDPKPWTIWSHYDGGAMLAEQIRKYSSQEGLGLNLESGFGITTTNYGHQGILNNHDCGRYCAYYAKIIETIKDVPVALDANLLATILIS